MFSNYNTINYSFQSLPVIMPSPHYVCSVPAALVCNRDEPLLKEEQHAGMLHNCTI